MSVGMYLLSAIVAAAPAPPPDLKVRAHSLDVLERRIDHYVDQSRKPAILAWLRANRAQLMESDHETFLQRVNAGLYRQSGDKHLTIFLKGPNLPPADDPAGGTYGISRIERLPGGAALIEITGFSNLPESATAVDNALAQVADAKALILDVRNNGGGGEVSFKRLLGHFLPSETELTAIEWRECAPPPADRPDACTQVAPRLERRFADKVASPGFPAKPIFVLVSKASFSAAEALAFELQAKGRATIVGEATGGGASPSAGMDLESDYVVIMPIGRMKTPDGRTWEGMGVRPDIRVPAVDALKAATSAINAGGLQRPRH